MQNIPYQHLLSYVISDIYLFYRKKKQVLTLSDETSTYSTINVRYATSREINARGVSWFGRPSTEANTGVYMAKVYGDL